MLKRNASLVRLVQVDALNNNDTEVFVLTLTKMETIHISIFIQSCCNVELQFLQSLKLAQIFTQA